MLSGGRLRLGLGVGWNPLEYEALGEDFHTRGKRMDEQIPLMQRLWTERARDRGRSAARCLPMSASVRRALRTIPIWLGGKGPAAVRRAAALGSGLILSGNAADPDAEETYLDVRGAPRRRRRRRRPAARGARHRGLAGDQGRRSPAHGAPRPSAGRRSARRI